MSEFARWLRIIPTILMGGALAALAVGMSCDTGGVAVPPLNAEPSSLSSSAFTRRVLSPVLPEASLPLRFFAGAAKVNSRGEIITGPTDDPVKNLVGAESAGVRGGLARFTKILFGVDYFNGRPDPGTRIDPNAPDVSSGKHHWPFVPQPFRSWPNELAVSPSGARLYVTLPGREGYPDWRLAVVNIATRGVRWIDLRPAGVTRGTRPTSVVFEPGGAFAVVLHQYGNFASVIDAATDSVAGEFETGFYAEKAVFNSTGTRLYVSVRNGFAPGRRGLVRAFAVAPGPTFTAIGEIPTGASDLEQANPRDLALSSDDKTLFVANTLGNRLAVIDVTNDLNALVKTIPVGGVVTDVTIAGGWGFVSAHETNNVLNQPETGHGLPKKAGSGGLLPTGASLPYTPVMTDATLAVTFDDIGTELLVLDPSARSFVRRYVDVFRNLSLTTVPGEVKNLGDFAPDQTIIRGSGAEQVFARGNFLFVTQLHSDQVEVFRIDALSGKLTPGAIEYTGGITPQGVAVSPDGKTVFVANMQTEDVAVLGWDGAKLSRQGLVAVGVTPNTPDPVKGGNGQGLFATHEEIGLRWFFTSAYADDGFTGGAPGGEHPQKSCGFCHWQSRHDGGQWNVAANALGGAKISPQNKDISDNWPEWFEGLNNDMTAYLSACNGELLIAERATALFPQRSLEERLRARDDFVRRKTEANSRAIGHPALKGNSFSIGYHEMGFAQILWSQNETRRMPNPLTQFPSAADAATVARGKLLFTAEVPEGAGCASCHQNGEAQTGPRFVDRTVVNDTLQDWSIHEPGVVAETTVDNEGPFTRLVPQRRADGSVDVPAGDTFFQEFGPPQDVGGRQNVSSRNTKHLRSLWDSVPRWLHHGAAHTLREVLLAPDSPLIEPSERGFNFRTVRTDHRRRVAHEYLDGKQPPDCSQVSLPVIDGTEGFPCLPTEVPITVADSSVPIAVLGQPTPAFVPGDGKGPIYVSLDSPHVRKAGRNPEYDAVAYPEGRLEVDQLGTSNLAPLIVRENGLRRINPVLAAHNIRVLIDTHGKTSSLSSADVEALAHYLRSLQ
ncbi:MAG TPA: YncE family protein [Myxococcaceae bacterium]|nr:YncE family protein [Myxococcaceae bacterium]